MQFKCNSALALSTRIAPRPVFQHIRPTWAPVLGLRSLANSPNMSACQATHLNRKPFAPKLPLMNHRAHFTCEPSLLSPFVPITQCKPLARAYMSFLLAHYRATLGQTIYTKSLVQPLLYTYEPSIIFQTSHLWLEPTGITSASSFSFLSTPQWGSWFFADIVHVFHPSSHHTHTLKITSSLAHTHH